MTADRRSPGTAGRLSRPAPAYYRITAVENVEQILRDGLRGSNNSRYRGDAVPLAAPSVFVLTDPGEGLTDTVAADQVWPLQDIASYAVVRIDPAGVAGRVYPDAVGERTARWQRIIVQPLVAAEFLRLERVRESQYPGESLHRLTQTFDRRWTPEEWELARPWLGEYGEQQRRSIEHRLFGLGSTGEARQRKGRRR